MLVISAEGKHFSSRMDISVFTDGGLDSPAGTTPSIGQRRSAITVWRSRVPSLVWRKHACPF